MEEHTVEEEGGKIPHIRARHIKKRALKNKAISVSFNEKDLNDYVSGFHKRKKKRRKEAQQKIEEALRRKRIEARKKRKLEREFVQYGGAEPPMDEEGDTLGEEEEDHMEEENSGPISSVSGTTMYDNGDVKVTVTTSEISHNEEDGSSERLQAAGVPKYIARPEKHKSLSLNKKKGFKKVSKGRSQAKPQSRRDKKKKNGKKGKKH